MVVVHFSFWKATLEIFRTASRKGHRIGGGALTNTRYVGGNASFSCLHDVKQATQATSLDLKEQWVCNIVGYVRHHLKDVKKGWFNLDEVSRDERLQDTSGKH